MDYDHETQQPISYSGAASDFVPKPEHFVSNKKLYSLAGREFFQSEDLRNPSGHEPDWNCFVAGPPLSDDAQSLEMFRTQNYVGLYRRQPGDPVTEIPDDHPLREMGAGVRLLYETTPANLVARGLSPEAAFALSDDVLQQMTEMYLGDRRADR